jgi:hypothetical protein
MSTREELERAYRRTVYRIGLQDRTLDLTIDQHSDAAVQLLESSGVRSAAFLTACNPGSRRLDAATNQAAQAALLDAATRLGHATLPGVALDPDDEWPDEESVLVLGIDAAAATVLARRFGQYALLWLNASGTPELVWIDQPADS